MTLRERILAVYEGRTPDAVPYMLDLSHWFYHKHRMPWDLSKAYYTPERELLDYHRRTGVGFYVANLASFFDVTYSDGVEATAERDGAGGGEIAWRYETPLGAIERRRRWSEATYSWHVSRWGVKTEHDLRVLAYALSRQQFAPAWDRYRAWVDCVGDCGVVYASAGYSAMGHLLNYWMGIERTIYAAADWPDTLHEVVDQINDGCMRLVGLLAQSPAEVVIMGDNFSSDIQSPRFFEEWSRPYYAEVIARLHQAGKHVAVHIDGRLRGLLRAFAGIGADCADAVTPAPMGDLTPGECRDEAGAEFILSGGIAPNLWLPQTREAAFRQAALEWLALARRSPRLIAAAGDQVPPGAAEERIALARDLVEEHGRY
jgi:hypothetical protein